MKRKESLKQLRKVLSTDEPPISVLLSFPSFVPLLIVCTFINFINDSKKHLTSNNPENQLEAAWCISSMFFSEKVNIYRYC